MAISQINTQEIQKKLCERLEPSGWRAHLKGFVLSDDFKKILDRLVEESQDGRHFTPKIKQIFRAFEECHYRDLKVIIVSQDPYSTMINGINVADGIAFSCSNTKQMQPSLKFLLQEVESQIYPQGGPAWDLDLKRWSNQGILMLNTALTTTIGKSGTHFMLWQPFTVYVLDYLAWNNPGLIFAFLGKVAQGFADGMPENCWKFKVTHPATAVYNNQERWESNGLFKQIDTTLHKTNGMKIIW